jgi:hypothetical protein
MGSSVEVEGADLCWIGGRGMGSRTEVEGAEMKGSTMLEGSARSFPFLGLVGRVDEGTRRVTHPFFRVRVDCGKWGLSSATEPVTKMGPAVCRPEPGSSPWEDWGRLVPWESWGAVKGIGSGARLASGAIAEATNDLI